MKLKLILSPKNMTVRLINVDAQNSNESANRELDFWYSPNGENLRYTVWINKVVNEKNSYIYNRVNVHFTKDKIRITKSYYCISEVIVMNNISFDKPFDSNF